MDLQDRIHVVGPLQKHTHTIILLHGRDSCAADFANEFFESQASDDRYLQNIFPTFKWIFPKAKPRYSLRFDEKDMNQWFDMWDVEKHEERLELQTDGILESGSLIHEIIKNEMQSVPAGRIILGGISQGCATAAATVLMDCEHRLGGFVGFSSWMPSVPYATIGQADISIPVLLEHCRDDTMVSIKNGRSLRDSLVKRGFADLTWKEYKDGGQWINEPQGVDDMVEFLRRIAQM